MPSPKYFIRDRICVMCNNSFILYHILTTSAESASQHSITDGGLSRYFAQTDNFAVMKKLRGWRLQKYFE